MLFYNILLIEDLSVYLLIKVEHFNFLWGLCKLCINLIYIIIVEQAEQALQLWKYLGKYFQSL